MELSLFAKYQDLQPNNKKVNKRSLIIGQIVSEINKERPCTYIKNGKKVKLGLITGRGVAMKVGHIKNEFDLVYILSICRDSKNRSGSFSQTFFGSLKAVDKKLA